MMRVVRWAAVTVVAALAAAGAVLTGVGRWPDVVEGLDLGDDADPVDVVAELHRPRAHGSGPVRCDECGTLGVCATWAGLTGAVA